MAAAAVRKTTYDVVVYGATGFTGGLVAEYLAREYAGTQLRWAIAGRSQAKLNEVQTRVGGQVPVVVCDLEDQSSVDALVLSTQVVLTTAGPFALHGRPLVDAVVRFGRSYVDITGEAFWSRQMMDAYGAKAVETGARVVSFCGFDSLPADLGTLFLANAVRTAHGQQLGPVSAVVRLNGSASGGTMASVINIMSDPEALRMSARPFLLNAVAPPAPHPTPFEADRRGLAYERDQGVWTIPFFMAGVNTRVVRRSHELLGYGQNFAYNESLATRNRFTGLVTLVGLAVMMTLLFIGFTRRLLVRWVLPAQGQGPTEAQRARSFFRYTLSSRLTDGQVVTAEVSGGDPGYTETSKMISEAALALLEPKERLGPVGFASPAAAMGNVLIARLQSKGITFKTL